MPVFIKLMRVFLALIALLAATALLQVQPGNASQSAGAADEWYNRLRVTKVSPDLYYGRQPREEDFAELKRLGIKTVISTRLNGHRSDEDAEQCKRVGLQHVHLPVGFFIPPDHEMAEFLQIVTDPKYAPVYIHCQGAWHRAPLFACLYRIKVQGWSYERAYAELISYGHFKPWFFRNLQHGLELAAGRREATHHHIVSEASARSAQ